MERSGEVSRLERFSDAVFGFAITLLVVSLEVPATFDELLTIFRGLPVFAVCFALLMLVWYEHHQYFRMVSLQDGITIWLNAALLFVVMIYIYPLKFLFGLLAGPDGMMSGLREQRMIRYEQLPLLMVFYGLGFITIFALLAVMYTRGWRRRRAAAGAHDEETRQLLEQIGHCGVYIGVGMLSISLAVYGGPRAVGWSGMIYAFLGPAHGIYHGVLGRRTRRRLAAARVTPAGPGSASR